MLEKSLNSAVSDQALIIKMWKRPKYLRNLHESVFIMFLSILKEFESENVPLVLGDILGGSVNTLTPDAKYSVQDCENLLHPIRMQLSEKPLAFSELFVPFLKSPSNFKHFEKEDDYHNQCSSKITHCQNLA